LRGAEPERVWFTDGDAFPGDLAYSE
jgi:hypothetical protein